ncbi:CerR family C-terminal domain-containing protein [Frigidibacter sp. ROC022]|uniref:CerR family C-terminal domain-containing protein n=1 Tax=Frigidibacter sp. ROC022 TaxID=2971796 RepID=UPI00215AA8A7|nr:CerR family C-terminal domain-containing protein [Frigidibacter sp. ROC022]MCR8726149.1 CerR family C-terminal domain-containing protein [Frigidibacter sp. ROC022]
MPESHVPRPQPAQDSEVPTGTRAALLDAGLHLFGKKGFDATSTRELAERAGTNVASIAYHFGGKDGLHLACGAELVRRFKAVIGSHPLPVPETAEAARALLERILRQFTGFLLAGSQVSDLVGFMLREVSSNGPVLSLVYSNMIEPKHRELCAIWARASGEPVESEALRLRVFSLLGQVLYFRIGHSIVARRMDWEAFGPAEVDQITQILIENLHRLLTPEDIK